MISTLSFISRLMANHTTLFSSNHPQKRMHAFQKKDTCFPEKGCMLFTGFELVTSSMHELPQK